MPKDVAEFGPAWAAEKLDMPRRKRELEQHIAKWLPELRGMKPGLVVDIGCGCGDFLAMCGAMGHLTLGIDDEIRDDAAMGRAYMELAAEHCDKFGVKVNRRGLMGFIYDHEEEPETLAGKCVLWHCRGAIEQSLEACMTGPWHVLHHDAKKLDWGGGGGELAAHWFRKLCSAAFTTLRPGGLLLILANGTGRTNEFYDDCLRRIAEEEGLKLVRQEGLLAHKWVRP